MGITVSELKNVNTLGISSVSGDFANASSWYSDALESFATDVLANVDNDAVWSGGGQSDAATVMSINRSALNIGKIEMDAASKVMDALHSALGTAQGYLLASLFEAQQKNITVHDDGSASYDGPMTTTPYSPYGGGGGLPDAEAISKQNDAKRIEREVKGQLIFADIADTTCKSVLDRIASHTPSYSSTADPGVLALNMDTLDDAADDQTLAYNNQRFWESAYPKALPEQPSGWDKFWHGVGNFFSHAWSNPDEVGHLMLDGLSVVGGIALADLGVGLVGGGGVLDLGGVTIPAGLAVSGVGVVAVGAGATLAVGGAADMGSTLAKMNSEAQSEGGSGEPSSTNPEPPRYRPGDNKLASRTYGKSTSDVQGQANNYAKGMEKRGYKVDVPPVRYGKYGGPDVTVTVYKKTGELVAIRHFIVKG